jgi:hypothetical protein
VSIKIPILSEWNVCTPSVFRFLNLEYVDEFFKDGSLRINSISRFQKHSDEQRRDRGEGIQLFVHNTNENGGQAITTWVKVEKAYVLSCTMQFDSGLMKRFNTDSYIRINETTSFGSVVARHIPGFKVGFEGHCLYQDKKISLFDAGFIDTKPFLDPNIPEEVRASSVEQFVFSNLRHIPYFLKDKRYRHQCEYRFVRITGDETPDYIDIKVPEALQFCEKQNPLLE